MCFSSGNLCAMIGYHYLFEMIPYNLNSRILRLGKFRVLNRLSAFLPSSQQMHTKYYPQAWESFLVLAIRYLSNCIRRERISKKESSPEESIYDRLILMGFPLGFPGCGEPILNILHPFAIRDSPMPMRRVPTLKTSYASWKSAQRSSSLELFDSGHPLNLYDGRWNHSSKLNRSLVRDVDVDVVLRALFYISIPRKDDTFARFACVLLCSKGHEVLGSLHLLSHLCIPNKTKFNHSFRFASNLTTTCKSKVNTGVTDHGITWIIIYSKKDMFMFLIGHRILGVLAESAEFS